MGTLYIVGTPIGNLEDVTMRALRVLREVDLIAAEDTRRTARLLQHYSIATPTTSLHEHNERGKSPHLVRKLQEGQSIAVVSDAGMPLVSDPGALLVRAAREAGVPVQVVPGPSAVTAALAGAGVSGPFAFMGFPPASGKSRTAWFGNIGRMTTEMPVVFFEAPHKVQRTMTKLVELLGNRPIIQARELTKAFETLAEQPIIELASGVERPKGEFVFILPHFVPDVTAPTTDQVQASSERMIAEFRDMTNMGSKPRAAAKALAPRYGLPAGEIYRLCLKDREN